MSAARTGEALTYCLNIHPAETWAEIRAALMGPVLRVRAGFAPDRPFPVGLRISARALEDLKKPEARAELGGLLQAERLTAVTVNGFPFGPFHGTRVKEEVYRPDWREVERLRYTAELAELMADIAPSGETVSLSTVPGCFRALAEGAEDGIADHYLQAAAHLHELERKTGVRIALAIEPEPACLLETIAETCAFFEKRLYSPAARLRFAKLTGLSTDEAGDALPCHLGLCYDVCHAAVEFEDPAASLQLLRDAGVPVHKLQLSAALRVPELNAETRRALGKFNEPTFLHQVVARRNGTLSRYTDLGPALSRGAEADGEEWRVHFHVPVFLRDLGAFESTRDFLAEILALHRAEPISKHLEVETYTWDVLPEELRRQSVDEAILRELRWVEEQLAG
ncbi:metabolite traffic protein EboE [Nitratireductor sp. GCM10026969]|uniref:metabolite traffic protein EboE n=1 Tax=Nitratireductor sp. GCM10026969 TaxID=3252645 RepID=UPI0036197D4C